MQIFLIVSGHFCKQTIWVFSNLFPFRHTNIKLEEEIEKMISEFDSEMFRLHNDIDDIGASYETEKVELAQARELLQETERRKFDILQEKRSEEDDERNQVIKKRSLWNQISRVVKLVGLKHLLSFWF